MAKDKPRPPATAGSFQMADDVTERAPVYDELNVPVVATLDGKTVRAKNFLGGCLVVIGGHPEFVPGAKIKNGQFV